MISELNKKKKNSATQRTIKKTENPLQKKSRERQTDQLITETKKDMMNTKSGSKNKRGAVNSKTNKDVVRVLNTFDLNKRNQEHMKENIESIELRLDSLQKDTDSKFGEINTKYDPKLNTIENSIEELNKKSENNSNLNNKGEIVQQNKEEEKQNLKITLENKDKIKELSEHLSELDKFIKSYVQKSGVDQIKNDISSLKTAVWNCSTLDDIKETKEREEELQKQISVLKENIDDLNANQIDHDDYNGYKRKVESLLNRMNDLDTTFTELLNRKNIN